MITFTESIEKHLGRADVIDCVILENRRVDRAAGRPGFKPYFLVKITFDSRSEFALDAVPTGMPRVPFVRAGDEFIITNGDEWVGVRHRVLERGNPDPNLYVLEEYELPLRLQNLTSKDKEHILQKIRAYVNGYTKRS